MLLCIQLAIDPKSSKNFTSYGIVTGRNADAKLLSSMILEPSDCFLQCVRICDLVA